jgi:hypothetical protein
VIEKLSIILEDGEGRQAQLNDYKELKAILGKSNTAQNVAKGIYQSLKG